MPSLTPKSKTAHLSAAPLMLAYLAIPLAALVLHFSGVESGSRRLRLDPGDAAWMLAAAFGTAYFAWRKGLGIGREKHAGLFESLAVAGVAGVLSAAAYMFVRARVDVIQGVLSWLGELAPLAYLGLAVLWVVSFGVPPRRYFRWFGAVLAVAVLADSIGASIMAGRVVYEGGWLFGPGSVHGERHACLLVVALFATLGREGRRQDGRTRWPDAATLLIMLGLLAGFSRTALFAAGWTYMFLDRGRLAARLAFAAACVACIALPLLMPLQLISAEEAHVFIMWMAGLETMNLHPGLLLHGFGPGPFELHLPIDEALTMSKEAMTLHAANVGPCWLRMTMAWGLAAPLLFLGGAVAGLVLRPARMAAGIIALCLVQGVVWPLLFDPGAAVIVFLGLFRPWLRTSRRRRPMAESATILVTCPKELPQYLKSELAALGFSGLRELTAGVETTGTLTDCMRLNLWVRTGHRVLYELARFRAPGPDVLYKAASRIDWEEMIPADGYLSVNASLRTDAVNDSRFAALKLKDAIVDRIRAKRGKRPDAGPEFKGCAVFMHWRDDQAIIYLDTSGEPLSRRGYRVMPHTAPLQETLAAGMLLGSGYESGHFVNPMCGSGTLAIEAALIGLHRAPGLTRDHFAFQHMLGYDRKGFEALKAEARSAERPVPGGRIIATDIDPQAIKAARTNAERAGVDGLIEFKACDFRETDLPEPPGVVMLNPEYGRRLGDEKQLEIVYTAIGDFFKQRCGGYMGYVFTGNLGLAKKVGLRTRRRMIFFNAKIECRLLEYELYAGTRKGGG